jgi:predicted nuclease of predicted toxin-antitoxin system
VKLLIDENLSPRLALWANDLGIPSQAVGHVGLQGKSDPMVWEYAYRNDQIVVTINVGDFIHLAGSAELHPGVIVLREAGLNRLEQWERLRDAIAFIQAECAGDLVNRVLEIRGKDAYRLHVIPAE